MEELLDLAIEDPREASRRALLVLADTAGPRARSYAHQALGIVARDGGGTGPALEHLRRALRLARAAGDPDRERDVRATYGVTLVLAGRSRDGLTQLDRSLAGARGELAAKVAMRKAGALATLGRHRDAGLVVRRALRDIEGTGNAVWEARTRLWLAQVELRAGAVERAEEQALRAERLYVEAGAASERWSAVESLASIASARGDVATALRRYHEALAGHAATGQPQFAGTVAELAGVQLAAGLPGDAAALLQEHLAKAEVAAASRADLDLLLAEALQATGDSQASLRAARDALALFRRQHRDWYALRARLVAVRARVALGTGRGPVREARAVAQALHEEHAHEAPVALTLAGRLANGEERVGLWEQAASYRRHPNALVRAGAWQARALVREEYDDRGGVLRACAAGLDAIDEHRRLIGSSELRALATTHGRELTRVALRHAADDPRTLLRWSERTRATALAQPPATSDTTTIPATLAALRDNSHRLAEARQDGDPTDDLERERLRLERAVRTEHHTLSATTEERQRPAAVADIVDATRDGCLVELVDVEGVLHVLVVHGGRVRRRVAGTTTEVAELLAPTSMLLRRASRGRPADLTGIGGRLEEAVLGAAAGLVPDGPVVLAPTARLHGLAWSLLPTLRDRPFSVVPSAGQWLRARSVPRPRTRRTVLVAGPRLRTGGAEVPVLARQDPRATLLSGEAATVDAVLEGLDAADLAHVAAHGSFRADSPLFSALDLADGPLTVHDLERVRRAPYRLVLSACESGVLAPVGADELLGLAAAMFSLGTAGLVSSVAEVNDAATAELMVALHERLAAGSDPATALCAVRRQVADDPLMAATAASFVALGV